MKKQRKSNVKLDNESKNKNIGKIKVPNAKIKTASKNSEFFKFIISYIWTGSKKAYTFAGALIVIFGWITNPFAAPEIHSSKGQISEPFELRFSIQNKSSFFQLSDLSFICDEIKYETDNGGNISNNTIIQSIKTMSIAPNKTVQYNCPFTRLIQIPGQVQLTQVSIEVEYTMIGFARQTKSETMTWTRQTGSWVEGALVN